MKNCTITKRFTKDINGDDVLTVKIEHALYKDRPNDRYLLFHKESTTYKKEKEKEKKNMKTETQTQTQAQVQATFEKAPEKTDFLQGEYFNGLCELAAAAESKTPLYIPNNTLGIFESLFKKRVFARAKQANGSFLIGDFDIKNRYLFSYNWNTHEYTEPNNNMPVFIEKVKELLAKKEYKVFSTAKPQDIKLSDLVL